ARACGDAPIEAFYSFAMEHEFRRDGDERFLARLDALAARFPGRTYVVGEPVLSEPSRAGPFAWIHHLSLQGMPQTVERWVDLFGRARRARLTGVYAPEHLRGATYFVL